MFSSYFPNFQHEERLNDHVLFEKAQTYAGSEEELSPSLTDRNLFSPQSPSISIGPRYDTLCSPHRGRRCERGWRERDGWRGGAAARARIPP